mmetsp:Transcript_66451/g.185201  ORF Transcript_66451/g.185201 Transcript_66451/m.185201 type:complete len:710 (+) Transcript_66451:60-2189(+)
MLSSIAFDGFPSAGSPRSSALPFNGQAQSDGAFGKPDRGRDGLGMTGPSWERDDSPFSPSAESPAANDALSRLKARLELSKGEATNGESASRAFSEIRDESTKPSSPTRHASVPRLKTRFDWAKPDDPHGDSSGNRSSANFGSQSTDDKVRLAMALENPRNVAPGNANWQDTVAPPPKSTPTRFREMADDNASVVSNVPSLLETSLKQQPLPPPSQPSAQHRAVDAAVLSVGPLARDLEDVRAQVKTLRQGQENLTKKVETADGGMEERMKAFVQQLFEKLWQSIMQCNSRVDAELQKREKGSADSNKKLQDDLQNCMEDLQTYAEKARQTNDDILRLRAEIEDVPGIRDLEDFSHGLRTELDALAERARKADVRLDTEIEDWTIAREALHKKVNDHADREKKELQDLKLEMKTLEQQLPPLKEWQHAQQQKQEKTEEKLLASASQLEQLSAKVQELSDNVKGVQDQQRKYPTRASVAGVVAGATITNIDAASERTETRDLEPTMGRLVALERRFEHVQELINKESVQRKSLVEGVEQMLLTLQRSLLEKLEAEKQQLQDVKKSFNDHVHVVDKRSEEMVMKWKGLEVGMEAQFMELAKGFEEQVKTMVDVSAQQVGASIGMDLAHRDREAEGKLLALELKLEWFVETYDKIRRLFIEKGGRSNRAAISRKRGGVAGRGPWANAQKVSSRAGSRTERTHVSGSDGNGVS